MKRTGRTGFYFSERCLWFSAGQAALVLPIGGWVQPVASGGHADSPESKRRLKSLMDVSGLTEQLDVIEAGPASREELLRIHTAAYIDEFKRLSDADGGALHRSAPFARGSFEIALNSAGLVRQAVLDVASGMRRNAYAVSRPSGHHCLPGTPMGFCLLANVPIAIEAARAQHGLTRVAVLDWDVHHGNGTQACFYDRADVLTISLHQHSCFPPGGSGSIDEAGEGAGLGANINVPLWPGSGHKAYIEACEHIAMPALRDFRPELIVVVNGLDANGVDPLARMLAHSDTFRTMTRMVKAVADECCDGRLVIVQEGGYAETAVPFCAHAVIEELAGVRSGVDDPYLQLLQQQQPPSAFDDAHHKELSRHPKYRQV
ncbi:class II histone deacetylase [Bradyrhizobium sp. CSA207]|uniref:class II histone deacetylase n=1 Tax=Bradyrhizobium sp. CSA207 TaxID=2698826 RepID=UPI0023B18F94|nr:class II histone deacetylase [Bradyrhizobium sp. CSA207]MDE5445810.1 class II histone deacetylase [Bradyrhizobium sp. CSA207]